MDFLDSNLPTNGTQAAPKYITGLADERGEQSRHYFTYRTDSGLMTGTTTSVSFTINRLARDIWPIFSDFNLWQNSSEHYYSGVIRELEGRTFRLTVQDLSADYRVLRVIPPYLLVLSQIVSRDGSLAGEGGFMVFMLTDHGESTQVSIFMQHEKLMDSATSEDVALGYWRESARGNLSKWRDHFIPTLKKLAHGDR